MTELARLRAFHAAIRADYEQGGHITRADVRAALDAAGPVGEDAAAVFDVAVYDASVFAEAQEAA